MLATTEWPPGYQLKRRILKTDKADRFILAELELGACLDDRDDGLRSLRRSIKPHVDLDMITRWLGSCKGHVHDHHVAHDLFRQGFRLIDVLEARLTARREPCDYVALSYVWGQNDTFGLQTTKSNVKLLMEPNALKGSHGERLPRVIVDAMQVCEAIGMRYLWVDCLAIVQDDQEEKEMLIHGMGRVYECASLTIFAASGLDARAGLAGIAARDNLLREKRSLMTTKIGPLSVSIARLSLVEQIRSSHWNSRGWTLQEQAFSARRLYFTPDEVFYECPLNRRREGYRDEDLQRVKLRSGAPWWGRKQKADLDNAVLSLPARAFRTSSKNLYAAMVSTYTRRDLSFPEDIFNAFTGIFQRCTNTNAGNAGPGPTVVSTQGIHPSFVGFSLLWFISKSDASVVRKRDPVHNAELASWTWASWIAPIDFICIADSSFTLNHDHGLGYRNFTSLISNWYFSVGDGASSRRISLPERPPNVEVRRVPFSSLVEPRIHLEDPVIGTLEFVAPCITLRDGWRLETDLTHGKGTKVGKDTSFENSFYTVKFDSDDQDFSEFIVILYDGLYNALCTRTVSGVSRRIGVAVWTSHRWCWETLTSKEMTKIEWRHIKLR